MCLNKLFKPAPFDPLKNGYSLIFREDWKKDIDWTKWDYREPWSGIDETMKEKTMWIPEMVDWYPGEIRLTATTDSEINFCGLISSHKFLNIKYGFIEVTAKMPPKGYVYFPAIWMYDKTGWLPEIDIVELMGDDSKRAAFTHHWMEGDRHQSDGKGVNLPFDLSQSFHAFAIEWTKNKITWFVDRVKCYEVTSNIPNVPLFLICNIGAGGTPAYSRVFQGGETPQKMVIKTIDIYEKFPKW